MNFDGPPYGPVNENDFPYWNERFRPGMVYLIKWEDEDGAIVKAGVTDHPSRWRKFVRRGAHIIALWRTPHNGNVERWLDDQLKLLGIDAFAVKLESVPFLGNNGGWMECHYLDREAICQIPRLVEEVTNGLVQGGRWFALQPESPPGR